MVRRTNPYTPTRGSTSRTGNPWTWVLLSVAIIAIIWIAVAVTDDTVEETAAVDRVPTVTDDIGATGERMDADPLVIADLSQLANNPDQYVGSVVTIAGEANSIFTPRLFTVVADGMVEGEEVLVMHGGDHVVIGGEAVSVTGTVEKMELGELGDRLGAALSEDALVDGEHVVVVANMVR